MLIVSIVALKLMYQLFIIQFSGMFAKFRKATISFVIYIRPPVYQSAWNNSTTTGRIFMQIGSSVFSENLSRKFNFH
jgi:hypothetical protein